MKKIIFLTEELKVRPLAEAFLTLGTPIVTVGLSIIFSFAGKYI